MNLNDAIRSHAAWKMKLFSYLDNPDDSLNATQVSSDSACELGQWLNGDGRKFSNAPEFQSLVGSHTKFHKSAGEIMKLANSDGQMTPEAVARAKDEFSRSSDEVLDAIRALQAKF